MDDVYYSQKIISDFLENNLFQKDRVLKSYYKNGSIKKFRNRLSKIKDIDKNIETLVYSLITDNIREIILKFVSKLTTAMLPYGDIIITGGEAFNNYIPIKDRIVTSDIDVKFVPHFSQRNKKFFGYLQYSKLFLWNYLGKSCEKLTKIIEQRMKILEKTKEARFIGLKMVDTVTRRYILIKKKKSSVNTNNVKPGDVLIDVELFSLDLGVKYFVPSQNKIIKTTLGGILDIPFMRPGEFGYDIGAKKNKGMFVRNPLTSKVQYISNIFIANKNFLINDLYIMHTLGLRPHKIEKDRKRMYIFSKKVLKVKNINSRNSIQSIFEKVQKLQFKTPTVTTSYRPPLDLRSIRGINPYTYEKYTTQPNMKRLLQQFVINSSVKIPKFENTFSNYVFNVNNKKWKISQNTYYIKNTKKYRPTVVNFDVKGPIKMSKTLYSFNPIRDSWVDKSIILKSSMIPFIGLKNKDNIFIKK